RMVQDWAGAFAFAAGDHIGFIYIDENSLATASNSLGWGFAHEVGHALDVNGRTIGETTNNMWSKFALAYFENNVDRSFVDDTVRVLTPDETAPSAGFFEQNRYNYQIWWNLEAVHHGFWGNLDNTYRYFDLNAAREEAGITGDDGNLSQTEQMVYYSSLVVGEDLGYYYERFGFSFNSGDNYDPFKEESASSAYKKLMSKAAQDGKIKKIGYKYWYMDGKQYYYDVADGGCYSSSKRVEIAGADQSSNGKVLYLPTPSNVNAHLGYEIMEYRGGKWYVIGFTTSRSFTDSTQYEAGYVPRYKIRAYDRAMNVSAESTPKSFDELRQAKICRIGETYYESLAKAIEAAVAGDTVYLCADAYVGAPITVNRNLTILPDASRKGSVTICKTAAGSLITVNGGVTLTLGSVDGAKIILEGNSFSQNGTLLNVGGTVRVYNAELRNNFHTGEHGGAVYNTGNSAFTNVAFINNSARKNGGAIANFSGGVVTLNDCTLSGNT
ncbi:MAG: M60 family metallopeptidase, partial [Clostridia bacterium]|nr:M60 family metallopeptidase [Clostridia bacterium]